MKQHFLRFFIAFAFLSNGITQAQNSRYLILDQLSVPLESAVITDSSAGGRMIYLATFEIAIRDNDNIAALQKLTGTVLGNKSLDLSIRTGDMNGKISEERFYQGVSVQEIIIPPLDGGGKNSVLVQVKIRSGSVSIKEKPGSFNPGTGKRFSPALNSNFRITLGNLATNRVAKISAIRIMAGQLSGFTIDITEADAKGWQDWLLNTASKKESGAIELLSPDFKNVLSRIELKDIEITSATSQFTASTESRQIARITVGLRGRISLIGK